jgi:hypothetical protein
MSEAYLPERLIELMKLRADAEIANPTAHAQPNPVTHWVPERTTRESIIDAEAIERRLLEIRAKRLREYQYKVKEFCIPAENP